MAQEIKFQDGESYEQWMGVWSQLIGDQFLEWLSPQPNATWIDIGCGNGTFTEQIYNAHAPKEIQALDPSPEQIDFALQRIKSENVSFQVGDAMNLPFEFETTKLQQFRRRQSRSREAEMELKEQIVGAHVLSNQKELDQMQSKT